MKRIAKTDTRADEENMATVTIDGLITRLALERTVDERESSGK